MASTIRRYTLFSLQDTINVFTEFMFMEVNKMNQYVTGAVIKELREKNKLTQLQN